jgi:hypothetical protein
MAHLASRLRIVIADGTLADYPLGGGHWSAHLQYLFGLRDLGHDAVWLQLMRSSGDPSIDRWRIHVFFRRFRHYGVGQRCVLLQYERAPVLNAARVYGMSTSAVRDLARSADRLWNIAGAVRQPILSLFKHPVFVDLDPGHLQVPAATGHLEIPAHRAFLTVGAKLHDADCEVPTLGLTWKPFLPVVCLSRWQSSPDPGPPAPFTSVTHWTWEELWWEDRVLRVSKRDAYLQYLTLPRRAGRAFELAAHLHPHDQTGDRELLQRHGWHPVHPYRVAGSPSAYQRHIRRSRAEFCCPKPIHRALRTGWFSDRSAAYLASGRPVLMEDTGIGDRVPTGAGLLLFNTLDQAADGAREIDARYPRHARAARELAEAYFDSRRSLDSALAACFT